MAIQVRRGNEVDFDPSKMLPGEWAVSLDTKCIRMCISPGVCLRMATYEAFEADMAEIQAILAECKTIQEAVALIQTEINDTAVVVEDYSILAQSYAVGGTGTRENEDSDNAKYYYEQTKQISQGINGIVPMGTVTFANLPTEDIVNNAMYNVSDAFTSDERFNDGGGVSYGAGNNVIWTAEGKWDVTASSAVTGIKGANESEYRQGNVSLSAENVGALPTTGGRIGNDDAHIDINGSSIVGDTNSQISGFDTISATYFDGDLNGTAAKAKQDKDGNDIAESIGKLNGVTIKNSFIPTSTLKEYLLSVPDNSINSGYVWNPLSDFPRTDVTKWYIEVIKPYNELIYAKVIAICTRTNDLYIGSSDEEGNITWSDTYARRNYKLLLDSTSSNELSDSIVNYDEIVMMLLYEGTSFLLNIPAKLFKDGLISYGNSCKFCETRYFTASNYQTWQVNFNYSTGFVSQVINNGENVDRANYRIIVFGR